MSSVSKNAGNGQPLDEAETHRIDLDCLTFERLVKMGVVVPYEEGDGLTLTTEFCERIMRSGQ